MIWTLQPPLFARDANAFFHSSMAGAFLVKDVSTSDGYVVPAVGEEQLAVTEIGVADEQLLELSIKTLN